MTATEMTVTIVETLPAPGDKACGLVWDGESFWFFELKDELLHQINRKGALIKSFLLKNACCDTAFDGNHLLQGSPDQHKILFIDPADGTIVKSLTTKDKCSGLCHDGNNYFRGSWTRHEIIQFDGETGEDIHVIETGSSTSGIAFDGKFFWHGGEIDGDNYLFKVSPAKGLVDRLEVNFTVCGLTYDGTHLWAADGTNHRLVKLKIE